MWLKGHVITCMGAFHCKSHICVVWWPYKLWQWIKTSFRLSGNFLRPRNQKVK